CPSEGRFVDNGDGTVTDHCTGLMWQKEAADIRVGQWCDALAYCEDLSLAGHDDWRLPNVRELESIVDYGRIDPAIDPEFGASSSYYWSSTWAGLHYAWGIDFRAGFVSPFDMEGTDCDGCQHVRAVRNAP